MSKKNIALIGCGTWGKNHLRNWVELDALAVVCDPSPDSLAMVKDSYPEVETTGDLAAVLARQDIAGVVVATPDGTHTDVTLKALRAGKDVLVEKPMTLTSDEGQLLVTTARESGRVLMVGHVLVYHAAVRKLHQLVKDGTLGRIRYIYSNRLNLGRIRTEENSLWSFAPHDVALILDLMGSPPTNVACQGGAYLSQNVADVTMTTMNFAGGVRSHIFVSWLHPFKEQRFVVVCDKQMAVFDDTLPWAEKLVLYPHRVDWLGGQIPVAHRAESSPVTLVANEPLRAECEHFLHCIQSREAPTSDGAMGLRVLQVLEAAQRSLDSGGEPVRDIKSARVPEPDYFAHPTAVIDEGAQIGEGTRVWHYSHIMAGARIGARCNLGQNVFVGAKARIGNGVKIQNNVSIYDGVQLSDDVFCGPSMVFTNVLNPRSAIEKKDRFRTTLVRRGATLGANCTIVCGTTIGRYALVGAGAVVTSDVPDYAIVWGVPARQTGWVCFCGETLKLKGEHATCKSCGRQSRLRAPDTLEPVEPVEPVEPGR